MILYCRDNNLTLNFQKNDVNSEVYEYKNIVIKKKEKGYGIYSKKAEQDMPIIESLEVNSDSQCTRIVIKAQYNAVFGLGERFDAVNQAGKDRTVEVIEKFCNQGEFTYCPVPFFFTDSGFGVYIDTLKVCRIRFHDNITIEMEGSLDELPELVFFFGKHDEILMNFSKLTGQVKLPPKWAFGSWVSANRWNNQAEIDKQVALLKEHGFPASVLVIEAWSDEATFYLWNETKYKENDGSKGFSYTDFEFDNDSLWQDPKAMIDKLHKDNIRLVLWQIPAIKKLEEGRVCLQHERDWEYAVKNKLVAFNIDGTPYTIPEGHWFAGSMIPDFTNPETEKWWFEKRQYLLDMGVDGFKTDGGEFIYKDDIVFSDGKTGREMQNGYVKSYVEAYERFIGKDRVLFSRAGYTGQHKCPIQWAGDQESTWDEFRSVIKAGLSIGLSGVPYWSFDIGGFAGPLPSVELYERATQMAVFAPVMQWHSEPVGGQFAEIMPSSEGINDRSPWNIARVYNDEGLIKRLNFHYNLRYNLIPYIYNEAIKSHKSGLPMMRHLALNYPEDKNTYNIEDEFMLGDLLIAPIVHEGQDRREVYLPEGNWIDLWSQKSYQGLKWITSEAYEDRIPVYIKEGSALALNLGDSLKLGSDVGNNINTYENLCFYLAGKQGTTHFEDDRGNDIIITWKDDDINIIRNSGSEPVKILRSLCS